VNTGLPGLAGTDHVGFTVPDLEAATRFFVDVIGCVQVFEIGPFQSDDDWMQVHLGVDPRAVIRKLRMFRCKTGASFEIFEYEIEGASTPPPRNSDVGGHHLAFYVEDVNAAVAYLKARRITVQGEPTTMQSGPSKGPDLGLLPEPVGRAARTCQLSSGHGSAARQPRGALVSQRSIGVSKRE
jgi:catechol 2,3-dioxygenase-like lactoylglutathione lyase family enzyme